MPISYDFLAPQRIIFGWGRARRWARWPRPLDDGPIIICGSAALENRDEWPRSANRCDSRASSRCCWRPSATSRRSADVDRLAADLRARGTLAGDLLLAIGGGAAIDLAKAVAAMATNTESATVRDYLEGVGRGLKLDPGRFPSWPCRPRPAPAPRPPRTP